jgi:hypothetical protein
VLVERRIEAGTTSRPHFTDYSDQVSWDELILPVLKDMGVKGIIGHRIPTTTAYRVLAEPRRPRTATRDRLQAAAAAFARERLAEWDVTAASAELAVLAAYLSERKRRGESSRRCQWCGKPMPDNARADARYHTDACRQAARRARGRG